MNLDHILSHLSQNPNADYDIAEIALLLAQDEYPGLDVEAYIGVLNSMAHEAGSFISGDLASQLSGLCRYMFHDLGFRGNPKDYYNPNNSYLNIVLEKRTGIPISLCAVVMGVGKKVGLDIQGIGLPGHFVAKAVSEKQELIFDPFHGGRRLEPIDCEHLVHQVTGMDFRATKKTLAAIPLGLMVQRMLSNLKAIYLNQSDYTRGARTLNRLHQLDPHNRTFQRDLGVCYIHLKKPGKAIEMLESYLNIEPLPQDAIEIEKLIVAAKRELAKWN